MPNSAVLRLVTVEGEGLRFEAATESGHVAVLDSGPGRIATSPIELLLISLAGCHAMDVISILRKKQQRVTAYTVHIRGDRRTEHPKSFTSIEIVHRVTGHDLEASAVAHAIELSRTKYCSVTASLDPAIVVRNTFEIVADTTNAGRTA